MRGRTCNSKWMGPEGVPSACDCTRLMPNMEEAFKSRGSDLNLQKRGTLRVHPSDDNELPRGSSGAQRALTDREARPQGHAHRRVGHERTQEQARTVRPRWAIKENPRGRGRERGARRQEARRARGARAKAAAQEGPPGVGGWFSVEGSPSSASCENMKEHGPRPARRSEGS